MIKDGRVLLVKRGKSPGRGLWTIPGGSVKLGEDLRRAAQREIFEETGIVIKARDPFYSFNHIETDKNGRVLYHYVIVDLAADYVSGEPVPGSDAADAAWFSLGDLEKHRVSKTTLEVISMLDGLT